MNKQTMTVAMAILVNGVYLTAPHHGPGTKD